MVEQTQGTQGETETDAVLAALKPGVFENANTISQWLLSQPEETQAKSAPRLPSMLSTN